MSLINASTEILLKILKLLLLCLPRNDGSTAYNVVYIGITILKQL